MFRNREKGALWSLDRHKRQADCRDLDFRRIGFAHRPRAQAQRGHRFTVGNATVFIIV